MYITIPKFRIGHETMDFNGQKYYVMKRFVERRSTGNRAAALLYPYEIKRSTPISWVMSGRVVYPLKD